MNTPRRFTLAFTGASGMPYGIRLLETLLSSGNHVFLMYSQAAQIVAQQEMKLTLSSRTKETEEFLSQRFKASRRSVTCIWTRRMVCTRSIWF